MERWSVGAVERRSKSRSRDKVNHHHHHVLHIGHFGHFLHVPRVGHLAQCFLSIIYNWSIATGGGR